MNVIYKTTIAIRPGSIIEEACSAAVRLAQWSREPVEFDFNGVLCRADAKTDPEELAAAWRRVMDSIKKSRDVVAE